MIKNNFTTPATYVSPAVKVTQLKARRVLCSSYGEEGAAGCVFDPNNTNDYDDNLL